MSGPSRPAACSARTLLRAQAAMQGAHRRIGDAIASLRDATHVPAIRIGIFDDPEIKITDHPELARYYESLGAPDSAIAVYERYLAVTSVNRATTDAVELGPTLGRLGALYAARGDRARAASYERR